jgi:hypothetical protein
VNSLNKNNLFLFHENQNGQNLQTDSQNLQTDSQSAKLAVIAGAITTFGDALSTMAAVLAIEEARQEQGDTGDNKNMQKQIDYLTSEIEKIKRQMNPPRR